MTIPKTKLLINNEWSSAESGKYFDVVNPATEEVIAHVSEGDGKDIHRAVAAARNAFEGQWRKVTPRQRGKYLRTIAQLIEKNSKELAELETRNNGKPIAETLNFDLPQVIECFDYYAGLADKIHGETIPISEEYFNYTLREPVGVVGQIIPWNFPLLMAAWKLGPALASGCTVILKPAEQTPLTAIRLGELLLEADLPPGVVNIVTGFGPTAGASLAQHMDVDKVAFTGSTEVGKFIMEMAAQSNLKRVSLELGGKSPNIIFADADIEAAVAGAMTGIFFNQGEVCCAGSRLFVEESIRETFTAQLIEKANGLVVGDPMDLKTRMGAQVSKEQFDKILAYIELGKKQGAEILTGGQKAKSKGYFIKPTVMSCPQSDMAVVREEIFGPVAAVMSFKDHADLRAQANNSIYGLAAGVWTKDITRAHKMARDLKAGTVWINCYNCFDSASPFGGYKQSGFGRELGMQAIELYTQIKSVWVRSS